MVRLLCLCNGLRVGVRPSVLPQRRSAAQHHGVFGAFASGFLARPIGGLIFGDIGNRIGRKASLIATLVIIGTGTFLIGLLPTFAQAGIWAPILLVILRVLQGIGLGGEYAGGTAGVGLLVTPLYGLLGDRFGRRAVYMAGAGFAALLAFPFFWVLEGRTVGRWDRFRDGLQFGADADA